VINFALKVVCVSLKFNVELKDDLFVKVGDLFTKAGDFDFS
jgi:hypothetical protein